jgi:hypothetical protein
VEPEHPAPILTITAATAEGGSPASGADSQGQRQQVTSAVQSDTASYSTLALVFSGAALVLSLVSAMLAWRSGRRPATAAKTTSGES